MNHVTSQFRGCAGPFLGAVILCLTNSRATGGIAVLGVQYQPDKYFEEDYCLWHDRQYPGPCSINLNTGQVVKVFLKNTGGSSVSVSDVTLAGRSMKSDIRADTSQTGDQWKDYPSSIYFANLSAADLQADLNAGEPVWYKADPPTIPAGGVGQALLRLRVIPVTQPVAMGVVTSGGTVTTNIVVDRSAPQLASVGFSLDRTKVYLHWRRSGGAAPVAVLMDGDDVTASATTVGDATLDFGSTVLQFATPLANMSFHVYQGVFGDGKRATGALRTWVNPFLYGTWAARPTTAGAANGQAWVNEATAHGVNVCVMNVASDGLADLMGTADGRQWMDDHGYGVIKEDAASASQILRMWFIRDEPDGREGNITGLPAGAGHNPGVEAMWAIQKGEALRAAKPDAPTTVNIDGNLKPYNYWNWGQVPDVLMTDPYYQPELADAYWNNNAQIPLYAKATQVYATARTTALACEPNPLHVILYSNKQKNSAGDVWPFPAPGTKRTEVYYALAGGAKGLAYWWYKTPDGLANDSADAAALWKEIGVLGNEIKTAQPLLVKSHPATLATTSATSGIWCRTLASGTDALIFLVVNDNHYNDVTGCHYTPIANATVTATLPSWLAAATAFEITPGGVNSVNATVNGTQLQLNLGTVSLTRMIVVTTDPQLQAILQSRYVQQVWPGICQFAPEYCTPQTVGPSITIQPSGRTVLPGGTAAFTLTAGGTAPLYYRWQKDNASLSDGGHYSGTTTATLTISAADDSDAAGYRCVVTNAYGSATSSTVTLTVTTNPPCSPIVNAGFEDGFTLYGGSRIGNSWTQWSSAPNIITGYDEVSVIHGGANSQRIRLWNTNGGTSYAGVYQQVAVQAGAGYTNSVWLYAYDTSSYCCLGVDPTGGTDPNSGNIVWSAPYNTQAWAQKTWTGLAAADYLTLFYRVQGNDNLKRNGYFDDAVLTCPNGAVPPSITQQASDRTIASGGATTFTIRASGSAPLRYRWQQNQIDLPDGGHFTGCGTDTLEVNGADTNDVAGYRCIVTNAYGSATSSVATLALTTVPVPPGITQQPSSQSVSLGGSAGFSVVASGDSPLSYQWQKNSLNLANSGHYSGANTANLTISAADSTDASTYRCVVTNAYGSATSSVAVLTLITNPTASFSLTNIPTITGDTTNDARALTVDGRYVAGISGPHGFLYDRAAGSAVNVVSSDGAQSTVATGVGYRTNGGKELLVSGLAGGVFTVWMTTNGGATWGSKVQGSSGKNPTVAPANTLAGTASDVFFGIWTDEGTGTGDTWGLYIGRFSNSWPATVGWGPKSVTRPDLTQVNGIAAKGRAVGWRQNGSTLIYANYVADWQGATTPAVWNFNGLDGTTAGQATAVSADGTVIFGLSPKGVATGATNFGYKAVFATNYPGTAAQLSIGQLPNLTNAAGSISLAVPYGCTADGKYAVGMNYRGLEKAVLWDTRDASPTNWTVTDLTDLALTNGGLNIFSRLARAYSVATNGSGGLVIVGAGTDTNSPAKTRAFVMTLIPPALVTVPRPAVTISGSYPAGFSFTFPTVASASVVYYLEHSTDLTAAINWNIITSTPGSGAVASLQDSNPAGERRFYRIRAQ